MKRREAREKAIQTLFQLDNTDMSPTEAISYIVQTPVDPFYEKLVLGTVQHVQTVDQLISKHLENWSLDRLPKIERTVLRLATYEILFNNDVPNKVIMNEAIELSKLFGDEKSGKFVNGVLSNIYDHIAKTEDENDVSDSD